MQDNYLAKWLNDELSEEELIKFKASEEYASYKRLKEVSASLRAPDFDMEEALNRLQTERSENTPKVIALKPYKRFLRIAAAIAILITGSYLYLNLSNTSYSSQLAENTEVVLPDNSEVILNADSKVTFNEKNWDTRRKINLKGEAFFKVAKGKKFTVKTSQGSVSVLGTQFNVENRDGFFEVNCYEGLVQVTFEDITKKLPAGTSFLVIDGKVMDVEKSDALQPSWTRNESSFDGIPLKYVFNELERQFDISVNTENVDTNLLFTGTFSNTDLKMALKSIATPSRIKFKTEGNNVLFYAENTNQ
ncbi:FecR family protein [Flagellimonas meridianipacifica]|uniref:Ferric-dicitrate binding protein FerR (Iron transport regulator) n=1 Tax=Flagellimonas meridianipacifica TaxID=1080225 RepID=A0A2T0M8B7_9FLAO|nr:FecR domain-containing protein [Allomuricauda pacifica]PRX53744.1 ferric-dicitrate binding protein FerR (iron transport regulator) [Allomuricauda pacifica]